MSDTPKNSLPTYFISHGGGPWPWIKDQMPGDWSKLEESLRRIPLELGATPRALLVVSGHWEESEFTVQTNPKPPMLYDYGGFPEFTYHIEYPAPGSPEVAQRVVELLSAADIAVATDDSRGFDHGVFAPMFVSYPEANVPIVGLSMKRGLDPAEHLAVGRALAPLRDEGVVIIGSGLSYHNLSDFGPNALAASAAFDQWLGEVSTAMIGHTRSAHLVEWEAAPKARQCHPREDHLIPLMVAVGAAESERSERIYFEKGFMGNVTTSSYRFGEAPVDA
ncbi:MAG: class III extradiol ring-cleavage dioxygenase [Microthrixaceae bacterium]